MLAARLATTTWDVQSSQLMLRQTFSGLHDMFILQDGAWGEKQGNKFIPRFTPEEHEFRLAAIAKLESGTMSEHEKIDLQQECVRLAQLSPYSFARQM